ncbi:hypothetical protein MN116_008586 [Schistosoma mekongi]|uniref:Uncharacterized protein n=1 Tax=Schistosoma mekongi TaxID=38744 RepID=A0AAE1Z4Z2_SCHME|nr:hypothetical protein MN116_008586 [Schistosoma mekongi]
MNYSMRTIILLILVVNFCCYISVKSQLPSTYQLLNSDDEYLDTPRQYSSTIQHKLHIPHYYYYHNKDKLRWSKRVPPYITGGIRY